MLPASTPLLATPQASQFYSLLKEEEEEECVCVSVFGRWEGVHLANRPFFSSPLQISQKAHLDFQLSDLLVSLSDIGAVKLSAGLHFMTCGMIIFLPFAERRGGRSSVSNSPQPRGPPTAPPTASLPLLEILLFDLRIYSRLAAASLFPAARESRAKETLTDVFLHPPESCRPGQRRG